MKQAICFLLTAALLTAGTPFAYGMGDAPSDWAREDVTVAAAAGLVPESLAGVYRRDITREELCTLIQELLISKEIPLETVPNAPFSDTDSPAVATLYHQGIVTGKTETIFDPSGPITREEAVAILDRTASVLGVQIPKAELPDYGDSEQIMEPDSARRMRQAGIMEGVENNRFAPKENLSVEQAIVTTLRLGRAETYLIHAQTLEAHMNYIAAQKRGAGSDGERAAATYIAETLTALGYRVARQDFSFTHPRFNEFEGRSQNIIAVKPADRAAADILYVTAHYDSVYSTVGAVDNASGVAIVLELARIAQAAPSDTEIRFVLLGAGEARQKGANHYVSTLTEEELTRSIGAIDLNRIGSRHSSALALATVDGSDALPARLINASSAQPLPIIGDSSSANGVFNKAGVPAVTVSQDEMGPENHMLADDLSMVNMEQVSAAAQLTAQTLTTLMDSKTAPYGRQTAAPVEVSIEHNIRFGEAREWVESDLGTAGQLVDEETTEYGSLLQTYRCRLKWLGFDQPFPTDFLYEDGSLLQISIDAADAGVPKAQMLERMNALLGDCGQDAQADLYSWELPAYNKTFILTPDGGSYRILVERCYNGKLIEKEYSAVNGVIDGLEANHKALWELVCSILPEEGIDRITNFTVYTDGLGNELAFTTPVDQTSNNRDFQIGIDIEDAFYPDGSYRNYSKLVRSIVHEYGHVLFFNDSQLTVDDTTVLNKYEGNKYFDDSYMTLYFDRFWADLPSEYSTDFPNNGDRYVSEYAAMKMIEDIAESFTCFVFMDDKLTGDTIAEQKVRFFYEFDEMVQIRTSIRTALGEA